MLNAAVFTIDSEQVDWRKEKVAQKLCDDILQSLRVAAPTLFNSACSRALLTRLLSDRRTQASRLVTRLQPKNALGAREDSRRRIAYIAAPFTSEERRRTDHTGGCLGSNRLIMSRCVIAFLSRIHRILGFV